MSTENGYNTKYHFDANLRDVPDAPEEMAAAAEALLAAGKSRGLSPEERARTLSLAGTYLRTLMRLDEARSCLEEARDLFEETNRNKPALVTALRLAHVYQWQGQFTLADSIYRECIIRCQTDPALSEYTDFAHQHYGKSLFDQGRYKEAEAQFSQALALREAKGNVELEESSRSALDTARAREKQRLESEPGG